MNFYEMRSVTGEAFLRESNLDIFWLPELSMTTFDDYMKAL